MVKFVDAAAHPMTAPRRTSQRFPPPAWPVPATPRVFAAGSAGCGTTPLIITNTDTKQPCRDLASCGSRALVRRCLQAESFAPREPPKPPPSSPLPPPLGPSSAAPAPASTPPRWTPSNGQLGPLFKGHVICFVFYI